MTLNKQLLYLIICTLLLTGYTTSPASVSAPESADKDSVYTLENVYDLTGRQGMPPEGVLDSIERREAASGYRAIPRYMIEYAKAYIASRQLYPQKAFKSCISCSRRPKLNGTTKPISKSQDSLVTNTWYSTSVTMR